MIVSTLRFSKRVRAAGSSDGVDHVVGPALEVALARRLHAEHLGDQADGQRDCEVLDDIEGPSRVQLRHGASHELLRPGFPGVDAPRRKATVHDGAHGGVTLAILGDQVARGRELERVEAHPPDEARQEVHELPGERRPSLVPLVHQEREHRARGEELRVAQHEHHVVVARNAEGVRGGRPLHRRGVAQHAVAGVGIVAPNGAQGIVIGGHRSLPGARGQEASPGRTEEPDGGGRPIYISRAMEIVISCSHSRGGANGGGHEHEGGLRRARVHRQADGAAAAGRGPRDDACSTSRRRRCRSWSRRVRRRRAHRARSRPRATSSACASRPTRRCAAWSRARTACSPARSRAS